MKKTLQEWYNEVPYAQQSISDVIRQSLEQSDAQAETGLPPEQQIQLDALRQEQELANSLDKARETIRTNVYKTIGLIEVLSQKLSYFLELEDVMAKDRIKLELKNLSDEIAGVISGL